MDIKRTTAQLSRPWIRVLQLVREALTSLRAYPAQKCHATPSCFMPDWQPQEPTASSRTLNKTKRPIDETGLDSLFLSKVIQTPNRQLVNFHTVTSCLHFQRLAGRFFLPGRQSLCPCAWAAGEGKGAFRSLRWTRLQASICV